MLIVRLQQAGEIRQCGTSAGEADKCQEEHCEHAGTLGWETFVKLTSPLPPDDNDCGIPGLATAIGLLYTLKSRPNGAWTGHPSLSYSVFYYSRRHLYCWIATGHGLGDDEASRFDADFWQLDSEKYGAPYARD